MELYIEATRFEPSISFLDGVINISGRSIPADSYQLFQPLISMFYQYSKNPSSVTIINIQLDYINSSSNRSLMNLLIIAENISRSGFEVVANWYYETGDEIIFEQGHVFKSLINIPMALIEKSHLVL